MKLLGSPTLRRLTPALLAGVLGVTALTWGLQDTGAPAVFRPQAERKGREVNLPRGRILLVQFLQSLADSLGETVCYKGTDPPGTTISLPRAIRTLDLKAARELLDSESYDLSRADYRGKPVYWVQKQIVPPRRQGKIVRPGSGDRPPRTPPPKARPDDAGSSGVGLYVREEGPGSRYILILETDSREEADEALSLLEAHRRSREEE